MKKTIWLLLIFTLSGCASLGFEEPKPTAVPGNTAWIPVIETFNNSEMVQVPIGCFMMGNENGRRDEQPVHKICFDKPFWIDRYEVTNLQFGSQGAFAGDNLPRENIPWSEALYFCAQRGARLPTEAEWEYAARGPDSWLYPWGNKFNEADLIYDANFEQHTWDVGSHPDGMSWVGAEDMSGNVWEWVSSLYKPYPYRADDGREDLSASGYRVYRGGLGSYIDYGTSAAARFRADPSERNWFIGFRCAKDN